MVIKLSILIYDLNIHNTDLIFRNQIWKKYWAILKDGVIRLFDFEYQEVSGLSDAE